MAPDGEVPPRPGHGPSGLVDGRRGSAIDPSIGLDGMLEALPVIAWIADESGRFLAANRRWVEYTRRPAVAADRDEAELAVHPADLPRILARWRSSRRSGSPLEGSIRLQRHDGTYRWHLVRAVPFQADDGRRLWIGTSTDIEDERRDRERESLVADAAARFDAFLEVDATIQGITEIMVPALADDCRVDLAPGLEGDAARAETGDPGVGDSNEVHGSLGGIPSERLGRGGRHLVVPLAARTQFVGRLHLIRARSREPFSDADRRMAREIARHAALAIDNGLLFTREREARRRAEQAAERTSRLFRLTRALSRATSRLEVGQLALRHGRAALGAPRGYVSVRSEDGLALESLAMAGYPPGAESDWARVALALDRPMTSAARTGREQWVDDLDKLRLELRDPSGPTAPDTRATVALPLVNEGRTIGVLGFSWTSRRRLRESERSFARAIAGLVAQALHRLALAEAREALVADLEAQQARIVGVVRQLPDGVVLVDAAGRLMLSNEVAARTLGDGVRVGAVMDTGPLHGRREDGMPYAPGTWPVERAIRTGEVVENELMTMVGPDGSTRALLTSATPIRDRSGRIEAGVVTFSDVTERRQAEALERYLSEATAVLASTLDEEASLATVASLAVPRIADWCSVELVDADGSLRQVVAQTDTTVGADRARELHRQLSDDDHPRFGPAHAVRTGTSQLVEEVTDDSRDALDLPSEARARLAALGLRSYVCVPLRGRRRVLGAITFATADSGRRFGPGDLAFAERLAERAASAIDNARLFREADRFRRIVEAEADAVFLLDAATMRVAYANRGAGLAVGAHPSRLVGSSAASLFVDIDPDRLRALIDPILEERTDSPMLLLMLAGTSGPTPVELLVQAVKLPGEPDAVLAIARDVSERVESQTRLRRLAEAEHDRAAELNAVIRGMGEGVLVCAPDGSVTLANPAALDLARGATLERYGDLLRLLEQPARAPALGTRGGPIELRVAEADERWLELTTYPVGLLPVDGNRETIVMLRDVTEARMSQAVRDTFIGVLSHELRTPITTIFGGAKVLARGGSMGDEQRQAIFNDIHLEAERLHRLVEDVIALTRFGDAGGDIGSEPVLLQRILPGIVRAEEARWPGSSFTLSLPPGLPTVVADPTYVEQVLRNLLSNAAKYGGDGVRVETVVAAEGDEVTVRILDDGPGFDEEEADRLFDLYFRSPRTAARASGAGIGLFVCARLIRAMGGRVWARPRPSGGAEFGFSLQLMSEDDS